MPQAQRRRRLLIELEQALDDTALGTGADRFGSHRCPQNRLQRTDQDRLTRSRLAGDDVESGAQFDVGALDQGKVFNVESDKHL